MSPGLLISCKESTIPLAGPTRTISVQYTIRHVTRFIYDAPITESVMEARVQPRNEGPQRCVRFNLSTTPITRVRMYQDHDGNVVHHFNIPGRLSRLTVVADALVECEPVPELPESLTPGAWDRLDSATSAGMFWDLLHASPFAQSTQRLDTLAQELEHARGADPLLTLRRINKELFERLTYSPKSTRVDSPIDDALEARKGVCQDFTHIMIALVRQLGIPCRYVSGYLFQPSPEPQAASPAPSIDRATDATAEAWLAHVTRVGVEPTH